MEWRLVHHTDYRFDQPVTLGPHQIRLAPAGLQSDRVQAHRLSLHPAPQSAYWRLDAWNNRVYQAWFREPVTHLRISNRLRYRPKPFNPFNFALELSGAHVPSPYLEVVDLSASFQTWVDGWRSQAHNDPITLAVNLNREVCQRTVYTQRWEAGVQTPAETLTLGSGSCRDTAWLLTQTLRALGWPSRFVSGYWLQIDSAAVELHAWSEVYVEGAGWIGLDPTAGLVVSHQHLPLAYGATPEETAPVSGSHSSAQVDFSFQVRVSRSR